MFKKYISHNNELNANIGKRNCLWVTCILRSRSTFNVSWNI